MKKSFLIFLRKNYSLMILSLIHPFLMSTTEYWGKIVIFRNTLGPFRTYDLYLICIVPIIQFLYGCIMYIITKKVFIHNVIPSVIYLLCFGVIYLLNLSTSTDGFYSMLFFTFFPIIFSIVGTFITAVILKIIKAIKRSNN